MRQKIIFFAFWVMFLLPYSSYAYDFVENDIYYDIYNANDKVARVTYKDRTYNSYTGSVVIPSSVTNEGITYSVKYIGDNAFQDCVGMTSVTIPNSVTTIRIDSFRGCTGLTSVTIPSSVILVGNRAFDGCTGLSKVEISDLSAWCGINFYYKGNPLTLAGHLYLNGKEITNLVIPESVTAIGRYAFSGCIGLTSITIPSSVAEIGEASFSGCKNVLSITSQNANPPVVASTDTFSGIPETCQLFVPESSIEAYKAAEGWSYFTNICGIKDGKADSVDAGSLKITTHNGVLLIHGAEGAMIEVYSISGMLIYRGIDTTIAMPHGMYMVKVADKMVKVIL